MRFPPNQATTEGSPAYEPDAARIHPKYFAGVGASVCRTTHRQRAFCTSEMCTDDLNGESDEGEKLIGDNEVESRFLLVGPESADNDPSTPEHGTVSSCCHEAGEERLTRRRRREW